MFKWQMFHKLGVLENFAKSTGFYLHQSLFLKLQAEDRHDHYKRLWHMCFLLNFVKSLRKMLYNIFGWQFLYSVRKSKCNSVPHLKIFYQPCKMFLKPFGDQILAKKLQIKVSGHTYPVFNVFTFYQNVSQT